MGVYNIQTQTSIRIANKTRYELDEVLLFKKRSGNQITQNDSLMKYIEEGIEREKQKMKEKGDE